MSYQTLLDNIKKLPQAGYDELVEYVEFLTFKFGKPENKSENVRNIGGLKGSLRYMADDFDAPVDDFKEYM